MSEVNKTNSEKERYKKERDKIKECAKKMGEYITNGYIDPDDMEKMKLELKLNDREMALVYNELGAKEAYNRNYNDAKSLFMTGIKYYKDLPLLHSGLGIVLVEIYKTTKDEKELKKAEKELKEAKNLIKKRKLEGYLSQELNVINELLESLDPPLINYPNILRRSIVDFFERINKKLPDIHSTVSVDTLFQGDQHVVTKSNNVINNLQGAQFAGGFVNSGKVNAHKIGGNITNNTQKEPTDTNNFVAKTILILAVNPRDTSVLRLDEEVREIDLGLQRAKKRELFDLKQRWALRVQDVCQALLDFKPQIVHFSGHGSGDDGLALEDEAGKLKLVDTDALANLFESFSSSIECIVLNACYSEVQAEAIVKHIPYVIGMNKPIGDKAAIKFATGFYNALGNGESIEFAYKLACNFIQLDGISEYLTPVLKKKQ